MTERQYLHVRVTEPKFYVKNSCCLLLAGNCLESYRTYCVCIRARSSVSSLRDCHDSAQDEWVVTRNYSTRWNKRKRSKHTLISPDRLCCQSVLSLCVQPTSEPEMTSFRSALTVKQTFLEKPRAHSLGSLHLFAVFISQRQRVFMCMVPVGLYDPTALSRPTPAPPRLLFLALQRVTFAEWFSYLPSELITLLQE